MTLTGSSFNLASLWQSGQSGVNSQTDYYQVTSKTRCVITRHFSQQYIVGRTYRVSIGVQNGSPASHAYIAREVGKIYCEMFELESATELHLFYRVKGETSYALLCR